MLIPQKLKFKKQQKRKNFKLISKVLNIKSSQFGSIRIYSLTTGKLTVKQLESIKFLINKKIKRFGRIRFHFSLNKPITKKPLEVRMGKGKGNVDHWVCNIKKGLLLFEIETLFLTLGIRALKQIISRLPIQTKIRL